jgi:hypothetical protein
MDHHDMPTNDANAKRPAMTDSKSSDSLSRHRSWPMSNRRRALMRSANRTEAMSAPTIESVRASNGLRALSPYNFFYRVERNRLLQEMSSEMIGGATDPALASKEFYARIVSNQSIFIEQVLHDQWNRDPSQKRKHRKVHGKITFESLTRHIAANWKVLPDPVQEIFREISARDHRRAAQEEGRASANESNKDETNHE